MKQIKTLNTILQEIQEKREHFLSLFEKHKVDEIKPNRCDYDFKKEVRIKINGILQGLNEVEYIIKSNVEQDNGK